MRPSKFDPIRPYYDHEVAAATQRIADNALFHYLAEYVYPKLEPDRVREIFRSCTTIDLFQQRITFPATERMIDSSIEAFTCSGIESAAVGRGALYVSNHRDITVDALLLQQMLHAAGLPTTEITFGSNLMKPQFVVDLGCSNKMFKVVRKSSDIKEFLRQSRLLSEYIRYTVLAGESVWIAQRNGRTKNGIDLTDQGLIKMFSLGNRHTAAWKGFVELNITPMSISYQIEPCAALKARETVLTAMNGSYTKAEGEDLQSILHGVLRPKGKTHLALCRPLSHDDLMPLSHLGGGDLHKAVAEMIDRRIIGAYRLFDTNFIAYDIRCGGDRYSHRYSSQQRERFEQNMARELGTMTDVDREALRRAYLDIYANPIDNKTRFAPESIDA